MSFIKLILRKHSKNEVCDFSYLNQKKENLTLKKLDYLENFQNYVISIKSQNTLNTQRLIFISF